MCVTGAAALRVTQGRTLTRDMLRQDLVWVIPYLSSRPNVEKDVVGLLGYLEAYSAGPPWYLAEQIPLAITNLESWTVSSRSMIL